MVKLSNDLPASHGGELEGLRIVSGRSASLRSIIRYSELQGISFRSGATSFPTYFFLSHLSAPLRQIGFRFSFNGFGSVNGHVEKINQAILLA
jgi:hypothetical protein